MKYNFPMFGFLLLTFVAAGAQVASHTPTVFTQPPAQGPAKPAPMVMALSLIHI